MAGGRVHRVSRDRFVVYLERAEDLARTMTRALDEGNPNGAALSAIHCVIAASDALTTFHLEERSSGQDHREAVRLLGRLPVDGREKFVAQFRRVLALKTRVEYESDRVSRRDANLLVQSAERALRWSKANVPSSSASEPVGD